MHKERFATASATSPVAALCRVMFRASKMDLQVPFSLAPTLDATSLSLYESEKIADGWAPSDVTRHIASLVPHHVLVSMVGDKPVLSLRKTLPIATPRTNLGGKHPSLVGEAELASRAVLFKIASGTTAQLIPISSWVAHFEETLTLLAGESVSLVSQTTKYLPPWRCGLQIWDWNVSDYKYYSFPRLSSQSLRDVRDISLFPDKIDTHLATFVGAGGIDVNGVDIVFAGLAAFVTMRDNTEDRVSTETLNSLASELAHWNAMGVGGALGKLTDWLTAIVPGYDIVAQHQNYYEALNQTLVGWEDGHCYLPGIYAWGVDGSLDELNLCPTTETQLLTPDVITEQVLTPVTNAVYYGLDVDIALQVSVSKLVSNITEMQAMHTVGSPEYLDIVDVLTSLTPEVGNRWYGSILSTPINPPASILQGTRLYSACVDASVDLLSEIMIPVSESAPALTYGQADAKARNVTQCSTFVISSNLLTIASGLDPAVDGSVVTFTVERSGVDPSYVYTVAVTYRDYANATPTPVATADQAKYYVASGARKVLVDTFATAGSIDAISTYLGGPWVDLVSDTLTLEADMRLDDDAFRSYMGPAPQYLDSSDLALRAWLMTKGVNRSGMERILINLMTLGALYPILGA